MGRLQKKDSQSVTIDLAEKHHVSLTYFQGKPYFHIRHNYNGKHVSLGYADLKSLVKQFDDIKDHVRKLKKKLAPLDPPPKKKVRRQEVSEEDESSENENEDF